VPNALDSTAEVYLKDDSLPDVEHWPQQFSDIANGTYLFRGVEVTLHGLVTGRNAGRFLLVGGDARPPVLLAPLHAADRVQWDHKSGKLRPFEAGEHAAYDILTDDVKRRGGAAQVTVTGPLKKADDGFVLQVRTFNLQAG
jgi:hypothetical protein